MDNSSLLSSRKIGVIGYGMFGSFLCREIFKNFKINLFSPNSKPEGGQSQIVQVKSLEELASNSDLIIPCVPISKFENTIEEIKPYLKENTVVMDVCSVKEYPVAIMKKHLPESVQIVASHPLFGPKPFEKRKTLKGSRIMIHNISAKKEAYDEIVEFFESISVEVIEMEEKAHDQLMAGSQFFTQMARHLAKAQNLKPTKIDTPAAQLLFQAFENIGTSEKLLTDMLMYNHYCQDLLNSSIKILTELRDSNLKRNYE